MKLSLIFLVLLWYFPIIKSFPTPLSEPNHSRFIIDNRKKFLFNKPYIEIYTKAVPLSQKNITSSTEKNQEVRREFSVEEKSLNLGLSIEKNNRHIFENYDDSPPSKHIRNEGNDYSDEIFQYQINNFVHPYNASKLNNNSQNVHKGITIQMEGFEGQKEKQSWIVGNGENVYFSKINTKERTHLNRPPTLIANPQEGHYISESSTTQENYAAQKLDSLPNTTSFPWEGSHFAKENIIYKSLLSNHKHGYDTGIETESYHGGVILKQSKMETNTQREWYEKESINYGDKSLSKMKSQSLHERNGKNYEAEKKKYEKEEKNYDEDEKNYEEEEKDYEEEEKNYEEEEKNYEEEEKNYEEEEENNEEEETYEEEEKKYEEEEKRFAEEEKYYDEEEKKYEEEEKRFAEEENQFAEEEKRFAEEEKHYDEQEKEYEKEEKRYNERTKYKEEEKKFDETRDNYKKNFEINTMVRLRTNSGINDNNKFGYVVDDEDYRKYRVEERTIDGFIVGEYGVVSHNDGSLRGVRYTADGSANPQLIYEALIRFLSL